LSRFEFEYVDCLLNFAFFKHKQTGDQIKHNGSLLYIFSSFILHYEIWFELGNLKI